MNEFDLNDALDDLIGGEPITPTPLRRPVPSAFVEPETFWDNCPKCGGTGSWRGRGTCFACNGKGGRSFKTSAADRAANREKAHVRKERDRAAWLAEHKAEVEWLAGACERQTARMEKGETPWQFVLDLNEKLTQWGSLTDGQLEAVRKCMARDAERKAQWDAERTAKAAAAPVVEADKLQAAFDLAREKAHRTGQLGVWLRPVKMFSGEWDDNASEAEKERMRAAAVVIEFSPAGGKSKNPGAIYAKRGETYLGKIQHGKWLAHATCTEENSNAVVEVCNDPTRAATTFGKAWSKCCVCGLTLTNEVSIERGIGPICAEGYGF